MKQRLAEVGIFFLSISIPVVFFIQLLLWFSIFLSQFSNPVFTLHLTEDTYNRDKYKENLALSDPFINQGYQGDQGDQMDQGGTILVGYIQWENLGGNYWVVYCLLVGNFEWEKFCVLFKLELFLRQFLHFR